MCSYMRTACCWRCCCCYCCSVLLYCCCCCSSGSAAVRHRVPDGKNGCWLIESDLSVFFLFIQSRFIFQCTPWQYCCRIYGLDLPTYSNTPSVIAGMRGAKAGIKISPQRRIPPCTWHNISKLQLEQQQE